MSTPSAVEARFDLDGAVTLLNFTWRGSKRPVTSQGRRWTDEDGQHFLVMTTGDQIVELVYTPASGQWRLTEPPRRPLSA